MYSTNEKKLIEKLNKNLDNHRRSIKIDVFTEPETIADKPKYATPEVKTINPAAKGLDKLKAALDAARQGKINVVKAEESLAKNDTNDECYCNKPSGKKDSVCRGHYYNEGLKNDYFTLEIEGAGYPDPDEIVDFMQYNNTIGFTVKPKTENLYLDRFQVGYKIGHIFLNLACPDSLDLPFSTVASYLLAHSGEVTNLNWFVATEAENDNLFKYRVEITIKD